MSLFCPVYRLVECTRPVCLPPVSILIAKKYRFPYVPIFELRFIQASFVGAKVCRVGPAEAVQNIYIPNPAAYKSTQLNLATFAVRPIHIKKPPSNRQAGTLDSLQQVYKLSGKFSTSPLTIGKLHPSPSRHRRLAEPTPEKCFIYPLGRFRPYIPYCLPEIYITLSLNVHEVPL
ncbi:hypothetical protein PGT21_018290 [Puccinia graminis f. sp. tritici]|uniref:Uncharacterized protein n=1 Tax=Puccinia graminis f. sp. tritici TaxID=56615 RepID=A0A5B0N5V8_PUCGR|nr:hypothetical protein PGT21_018290 [Puccinia graminis f. sp. tritici]KAA1093359.1 hypothetical protein PGTUg99_025412 [Puccinia graminis f. sp. tritici]